MTTISPASEATGLAVAEHADLDLDAGDELLDQHLLVVAEGELDRGAQLVVVVRLRDPDRRAEPRGLDEHRVAERVLGRVAGAQRDVARDRDALVAHHRLEQVLVHAERRGRTPAPTYGTPAISSSPCTVPSSPKGPWRIGSTTSTSPSVAMTPPDEAGTGSVSAAGPFRQAVGAGTLARGAGPERPASVAADLDRDHLVAVRIERLDHRPGRRERDLVLATSGRPSARRRAGASGCESDRVGDRVGDRRLRRRGVGRQSSAVGSVGCVVVSTVGGGAT